MRIRATAIALAVQLAACQGYEAPMMLYQGPTDGVAPLPFDETWNRAIAWFATNNVPLKHVAKDSGLIATEYGLATGDLYVDCGRSRGADTVTNRQATVNVLVRAVDEKSTNVQVNVFGTATVLSESYGLGSGVTQIRCRTTGVLEQDILWSVGAI